MGVSATTFLTWVEDDRNGISERYARVREACFDAMAEAIIDLADDDSRDVVIDDEGKEVERPLRVNHARLQFDSRKWLLAKALPHKYDNRVQVEREQGFGGGGVTIVLAESPEAKDLIEPDEGTEPQGLPPTPIPRNPATEITHAPAPRSPPPPEPTTRITAELRRPPSSAEPYIAYFRGRR